MSNKCMVQTATKYTSDKRPSPPFPANECCGQYKWGNNGQLYKSVADKKNICKWKVVNPKRVPKIHWAVAHNHPSLYGIPYNFDSYVIHNYSPFDNSNLSENDFSCGTLISINVRSEVDLKLSNGKDYKLRGEADLKEQEKYVDSKELFGWYRDVLDELGWVPLTYTPNNPIVLVSASLYDIDNIIRDGIQLNIVMASKKPLNKIELLNALEGLTNMEGGNGNSAKIKSNTKYESRGLITTSAGWGSNHKPNGNYKLTTWKNHNKNIKTSVVGKIDNIIPTYPILDAILDKSNSKDDIARYHYSNKKNSSAKPTVTKPKPQKDCPKGKVRSPKGRCVKEKKPSATKPKPQKACPKGEVRSPKGRCVKVKKPSATKTKPQKACPKGKVRSPKGRCVKENKPSSERKEISKLTPPNCFEQTTKKYTSPKRKSPPFKANLCCNAIMLGNNGKLWESVPNKKGICTWKPY